MLSLEHAEQCIATSIAINAFCCLDFESLLTDLGAMQQNCGQLRAIKTHFAVTAISSVCASCHHDWQTGRLAAVIDFWGSAILLQQPYIVCFTSVSWPTALPPTPRRPHQRGRYTQPSAVRHVDATTVPLRAGCCDYLPSKINSSTTAAYYSLHADRIILQAMPFVVRAYLSCPHATSLSTFHMLTCHQPVPTVHIRRLCLPSARTYFVSFNQPRGSPPSVPSRAEINRRLWFCRRCRQVVRSPDVRTSVIIERPLSRLTRRPPADSLYHQQLVSNAHKLAVCLYESIAPTRHLPLTQSEETKSAPIRHLSILLSGPVYQPGALFFCTRLSHEPIPTMRPFFIATIRRQRQLTTPALQFTRTRRSLNFANHAHVCVERLAVSTLLRVSDCSQPKAVR